METKPGYKPLGRVLEKALAQAQMGKGVQRHAEEDQAWFDQVIFSLAKLYPNPHLFQAAKKMHECQRLPEAQAVRELLGAINYLAAAINVLEGDDRPGKV